MSSVPYGPVDRDATTATFFDAAARGELVVRACRAGHLSSPEVLACTSCRDDVLAWSAPLSGDATLMTWIVVPGRASADGVVPPPKIAAAVELAEGPWVTTGLVDLDPSTLHAGLSLRVRFIRPEDSEAYPVFGPA
jgi:uncharacterized protein